jgi:hypothetical protein
MTGSHQGLLTFHLHDTDPAYAGGFQVRGMTEGGDVYAGLLSDLKNGHAFTALGLNAIYHYLYVLHLVIPSFPIIRFKNIWDMTKRNPNCAV